MGQHNAAQPGMRVNKTTRRKNCKMQLPRCGLKQQNVARSHPAVGYCPEAITIKKSQNSGLVIAAQRVIAGYRKRAALRCQRRSDHADTIQPSLNAAPARLEPDPDDVQSPLCNFGADISCHRDSASEDHFPADKAPHEN